MADNYGTLADALAYHHARGNSAWAATGDDEAKLASLVRASVWVDSTYRSRFSGRKTGGRSQEREWPRIDAADAAGDSINATDVPSEIEAATYEAALRELVRHGSLAPDYDGSKSIKSERQKVGPIEEEIEYAEATAASSKPVFAVIDGILSGLLTLPSGSSSVTLLCRL